MSTEEVASSRIRTRGSWARARAKREELLLAHGERGPALLHLGVVALRQGLDEAMGVHGPRRRADPLVGDRGAEADVGGDGAAEEVHVLQHEGQRRAQLRRVELAHVDPVQGHPALLHVVEARRAG